MIALVGVVLLCGAGVLYFGTKYYERRQVISVCRTCGLRRDTDEIYFGRFRVRCTECRVSETYLCGLLGRAPDRCAHDWALVFADRSDWRGRARLPNIADRGGITTLVLLPPSEESLARARSIVPDLPERIRTGILNTRHPACGAARAGLLRTLWAPPSALEARLFLYAWSQVDSFESTVGPDEDPWELALRALEAARSHELAAAGCAVEPGAPSPE